LSGISVQGPQQHEEADSLGGGLSVLEQHRFLAMQCAEEISSAGLVKRGPKVQERDLLLLTRVILDDPAESTKVLNSARIILRLLFQLVQPDLMPLACR
jgi:hypothetical protein